MRIKETISADEIGSLEDALPGIRKKELEEKEKDK